MDVAIVFLSVLGIVLEELKSDLMPINPTIMRVMRVLRIARGSNTYNTYTFSPHYARANRVRVTTNTASEYKYLVFRALSTNWEQKGSQFCTFADMSFTILCLSF